jgi:hypothetical protein
MMGTYFTDGTTELSAANLNAIDRGGLVRVAAGGGLFVAVSACSFYYATTPAYVSYAGTASQAVTASNTNYVYLTAAGVLTVNTTGFPDPAVTPHLRLATVVCGGSSITSITDSRPGATI